MIEEIKKQAKIVLGKNDDAHGYEHAERVANLVKKLNQQEDGDELVVETSCYMHDWCSNGGREYHVSEEAMQKIKSDFVKLNLPENKIESVIEAVRHHEEYNFKNEKKDYSIETQILQDVSMLHLN